MNTIWVFGPLPLRNKELAGFLKEKLDDFFLAITVLEERSLALTLNSDLSESVGDKQEAARRIAETCKLLCDHSVLPIASFVTEANSMRWMVRKIVEPHNVWWVHLRSSLPIESFEEPEVEPDITVDADVEEMADFKYNAYKQTLKLVLEGMKNGKAHQGPYRI